MIERWLPVVGYEGLYEVSDQGRVRSLDRLVPHGRGGTMRRRKGQVLKPGLSSAGYETVTLGKRGSHGIHVLMLTAFVGPCPPGHECRHLDDVRTHNRLPNLAWGTRSDNMKDMYRNGGRSRK